MNNILPFFKPFIAILSKDIETSDEFIPLDENLFYDDGRIKSKAFVHTGKFNSGERGERGEWEDCIIKAGSRVWAQIVPSNEVHIMTEGDNHTVHARCSMKDISHIIIDGQKFSFKN